MVWPHGQRGGRQVQRTCCARSCRKKNKAQTSALCAALATDRPAVGFFMRLRAAHKRVALRQHLGRHALQRPRALLNAWATAGHVQAVHQPSTGCPCHEASRYTWPASSVRHCVALNHLAVGCLHLVALGVWAPHHRAVSSSTYTRCGPFWKNQQPRASTLCCG